MHQLSAMLLLWAGVSAAGLAAATLVVAVETCTRAEECSAAAFAPRLPPWPAMALEGART